MVWCGVDFPYDIFLGWRTCHQLNSFVVCQLECTGISLRRPRHVTEVDRTKIRAYTSVLVRSKC